MALDELRQYLSQFDQASNAEEKWFVAQKYHGKQWFIDIPIIAGEYIGDYWVIDHRTDDLGRVILAIPLKDENTMHRFLAMVVDDYALLEMTGAALVAVG